MGKRHDRAVDRLTKIFGGKHRRQGIDLVSKGLGIEVAVTDNDVKTSVRQLQRSRVQTKYLSVPSELVDRAKKQTKGTGIGVRNLRGTIKKRARRKRR